MSAKKIPLPKRKEVFHALVATQDTGTMTVRDSMRQAQVTHGLTEGQLEEIIEEGVEKEWLDEVAVA